MLRENGSGGKRVVEGKCNWRKRVEEEEVKWRDKGGRENESG